MHITHWYHCCHSEAAAAHDTKSSQQLANKNIASRDCEQLQFVWLHRAIGCPCSRSKPELKDDVNAVRWCQCCTLHCKWVNRNSLSLTRGYVNYPPITATIQSAAVAYKTKTEWQLANKNLPCRDRNESSWVCQITHIHLLLSHTYLQRSNYPARNHGELKMMSEVCQ